MLYQLTSPTPHNPRVDRIVDLRELAVWFEEDSISLAEGIQYIDEDGDQYDDGGYDAYFDPSTGAGNDCLLVTLADGNQVVTSPTGLQHYMDTTGQVLPVDLPR